MSYIFSIKASIIQKLCNESVQTKQENKTGSLVKISQKQDAYSYISYNKTLNYFCLLKVKLTLKQS